MQISPKSTNNHATKLRHTIWVKSGLQFCSSHPWSQTSLHTTAELQKIELTKIIAEIMQFLVVKTMTPTIQIDLCYPDVLKVANVFTYFWKSCHRRHGRHRTCRHPNHFRRRCRCRRRRYQRRWRHTVQLTRRRFVQVVQRFCPDNDIYWQFKCLRTEFSYTYDGL